MHNQICLVSGSIGDTTHPGTLEHHDEYFALVRVSEPSGLRPRDLFCIDETQLFQAI